MPRYRSPDDRYIPDLGLSVTAGEEFDSPTDLGGPFEAVDAPPAKPASKVKE